MDSFLIVPNREWLLMLVFLRAASLLITASLVLTVAPTGALPGAEGEARADDQSNERRPVPELSVQREKLAIVKATFREEYRSIRRRDVQRALARKLQESASTTTESDDRYVLLDEAQSLAARAGDWQLALELNDEMARTHRVDELQRKAAALSESIRRCSSDQANGLSTEAFVLTARAVSTGDITLALELAQAAQLASRKTRDTKDARRSIAAVRVLKQMHELGNQADAARKELVANPDSPSARLTHGRFLCIVRHDWEAGLEQCAGGAGTWSRLAQQEAKALDQVSSQLELAGAWYSEAATADEIDALAMKLRARYWYRIAAATKPGGVAGVQLEERLRELESVSAVPGINVQIESKTTATVASTDSKPDRDSALRDDRTPLVGGKGGEPFEFRIPAGTQLIGFRISDSVPIHSIQPIYRDSKGVHRGPVLGEETSKVLEVVAKKGYVVGGFVVKSGDFVKGLSVTFREANRKTRAFRWYDSPWIGDRDEGRISRIGRTDLFVDGVYGRGKGLIDAIGIIGRTSARGPGGATPPN